MSEMYDEDQPWHLTQEPEGQPSYEELADRIEELEGKLAKAVAVLEFFTTPDVLMLHIARTTLAELKGQDDE